MSQQNQDSFTLPVKRRQPIIYGNFSAGNPKADEEKDRKPHIAFVGKRTNGLLSEWVEVGRIPIGEKFQLQILDVKHREKFTQDGKDISKMVIKGWNEESQRIFSVSFGYSNAIIGMMLKLASYVHGDYGHHFGKPLKYWNEHKADVEKHAERLLEKEKMLNKLQGKVLTMSFSQTQLDNGHSMCEVYFNLADNYDEINVEHPTQYCSRAKLINVLFEKDFKLTPEEREAAGQTRDYKVYGGNLTKEPKQLARFTNMVAMNMKSDFKIASMERFLAESKKAATKKRSSFFEPQTDEEPTSPNPPVPNTPKVSEAPKAGDVPKDASPEDDLPF